MTSSSVQGKLTAFGYKKMKLEGEEQLKVRPNTVMKNRLFSFIGPKIVT